MLNRINYDKIQAFLEKKANTNFNNILKVKVRYNLSYKNIKLDAVIHTCESWNPGPSKEKL